MEGYQSINLLTIDQLKGLIQEVLKPFLTEMKTEIADNSKEETKLVNIKVVMEKLQVTKPTIYNWINKGIIKREKIGGKVLFDLQSILLSIKENSSEFGKGRDYLYKSCENPKETKEDRKYCRINWKKMAKQPLTYEEEVFLFRYNKLYKDNSNS